MISSSKPLTIDTSQLQKQNWLLPFSWSYEVYLLAPKVLSEYLWPMTTIHPIPPHPSPNMKWPLITKMIWVDLQWTKMA